MYFKSLYECVTQYVCTSEDYQVTCKIFLCKVRIMISLKSSVIWTYEVGVYFSSITVLPSLKQASVCVHNQNINPRGLVSSKTLSRRLLSWPVSSISLKETTNVFDRREDCWSWPPGTVISWVGTKGFEGVTTCGKDQGDVWVEVVGRDYWWRWSTRRIETAEGEYGHSQWKQVRSVPLCWAEGGCVRA